MTGGAGRVPTWMEETLREMAVPERRAFTAKYFPSSLEILGVPAPQIRKVVRRLHQEARGEDPGYVVELAFSLRGTQIHECRQAATRFAGHMVGCLVQE